MNTQVTPPPKKNRFLGFIRFVVRFLFVLILAIGIGAGIYYLAVTGIPWLYQRYVQPVEENTLRLDDLEAHQDQELDLLTTRLESMQQRLTDLEIQSDVYKETISSLESKLAAFVEIQEAQSEALVTLEPVPSVIVETQSDLVVLQGALGILATTIESLNQQITSLSEEEQAEPPGLVDLKNEMQLFRGMEFLTRARLFLSLGNLEEAESNNQDVLELLTILVTEVPDYQRPALEQINVFLLEALLALPDSPVRAADQLEGAWSLIKIGLPEEKTSTPAQED
ncbi:MAG: hypothetical protein ISR58_11310 [Anaerolineales bacterium]|nr:hypothetical protein [Chloroflexota bacterium]MBL6981763.1 hypothetical protein [Anaerolineales bacterium]